MITRFATLTSRMAVTFAILFTLAACGGGGGGGSDSGFLPDDGPTYRLRLVLTDANGDPTTEVTATNPITLSVTVTRDKKPVPNVVATASTDIASILPASGTALTDANGVALFQIAAAGQLGAGTVEVSVDNPNPGQSPSTKTISYQVGQAGLRLGHFDSNGFVDGVIGAEATEVAVGGSALLRFAVVDENGELVSDTETIGLKSGCSLSGLADLPATVETVNGQATATYTAAGCGGDDEVIATLQSNAAQATTTLTVAPPEADVIEFVAVRPDTSIIALKGTGTADRPETATVTFRVVSGENTPENPGKPLPGIPVKFKISTDVGGLALQNDSATTNAAGEVKASVQSGSVATSVTVTATIQTADGEGPSTASPPIVVSTGLPDQNSISISTSALNVRGAMDFDGKTAEITVRLADKFNNPVADGTSAVFTTEYGSIQSSCVTAGGTCTVTWTSQDPRLPVFNQDLVRTIRDPDYKCDSHNGDRGPCADDLGAIHGLRTTILVTVVGEEYFVDSNGNGLYDEGEPFENLPEAFVDHNEDGVYTPVEGPHCPVWSTVARCEAAGAEETFIDFNGDGKYSLNVDPNTGKGVYNGSLCPVEGDGIWCSRELVNVRDDIVLIMSSQATFDIILVSELRGRVVAHTDEGDRFLVHIADFYNNRPAAGVPITVEATGDCEILTPKEFTVPDSNRTGAFTIPLETTGDGGNGTVTITAGDSSETFGCWSIPDPVTPDPDP
ncbi:MAG: hypothetical protein KDI16_15380 [Halioglobus sp.]|nr:hypothetical protein [Halioglobus sp.]